MMIGRFGGAILVREGEGLIDFSGFLKDPAFGGRFSLEDFNPGKVGLFSALGIRASALFAGTGSIQGDLSDLTTLEGAIDTKILKLNIDPQSVLGFQLPHMNIIESRIEVTAEKGKIRIRTLQETVGDFR